MAGEGPVEPPPRPQEAGTDDDVSFDNGQLLMAVYHAFNKRDIDTVLSVLTPDVDWANGLEGGRLSGTEAVRQYWLHQWQTTSPEVEPISAAVDEQGRTVVEVRLVVRDSAGALVRADFVQHVFTFDGLHIRRFDIEPSDLGEEDL